MGTIPGNMPAKFEVPTFSRFGADRQMGTSLSEMTAWLMVTTPTFRTYDIRHMTYDTQSVQVILESSNVLLTQCIGQTINDQYTINTATTTRRENVLATKVLQSSE